MHKKEWYQNFNANEKYENYFNSFWTCVHFDISLKSDTLGSTLSKFITCWVEAKNMPLQPALQEILMQIAYRHYWEIMAHV